MFRRLDKFDELICGWEGGAEGGWGGGVNTRMAYLRDVNWVTYLGGAYIRGGGFYMGGLLRGFYGTFINAPDCFNLE